MTKAVMVGEKPIGITEDHHFFKNGAYVSNGRAPINPVGLSDDFDHIRQAKEKGVFFDAKSLPGGKFFLAFRE